MHASIRVIYTFLALFFLMVYGYASNCYIVCFAIIGTLPLLIRKQRTLVLFACKNLNVKFTSVQISVYSMHSLDIIENTVCFAIADKA